MNKDKISLDTNIIRRLFEDNATVENLLNDIYISHEFIISDMTLYEITDHICRLENEKRLKYEIKFRNILHKYKILLQYKKDYPRSKECYNRFILNKFSVLQLRNNILPSYAFSLSKFITNIFVLTFISIINSLGSTSVPLNLYLKHITNPNNKNNLYVLYENIFENCILNVNNTDIKLNKFFNEEFKKMIIKIMCVINLSNKSDTWDISFQEKQEEMLNEKYKEIPYIEILKSIINQESIVIKKTEEMNSIDFCFISNYIEQINLGNKVIKINDITDYLNFSNSFMYRTKYLTLDEKSIKQYKKYFKNFNDILSHINNKVLTKKI